MSYIGQNGKMKSLTMQPLSSDITTASEGMLTSHEGTTRAVGFWGYLGGAWKRLALATEVPSPTTYVTKNDNYTVTDGDGYGTIAVTVVNKTITLPTAADNTSRVIKIIKSVSGAGTITIKGEAAGETVDGVTGTTGITLDFNKEVVTLQCTGSVWVVLDWTIPEVQYDLSSSGISGTSSFSNVKSIGIPYKTRAGEWRFKFTITGTVSSSTGTAITLTGVTFKNVSGYFQGVAGSNTSGAGAVGYVTPNTGDVNINAASAVGRLNASGDVELESKPTFVV